MNGQLWLDLFHNELKQYDLSSRSFKNVFENKFKITDYIMNDLVPDNPIPGQLWIYNGVLFYFDGAAWQPMKALIQDESQLNLSVFEDFILISPLNAIGNCVVDDIEYAKWYDFIYNGKLDPEAKSQFVYSDVRWNPLWENPVKDPQEQIIPIDAKMQFPVANINVDRFFIGRQEIEDYEKVNKICIQYPKNKIEDKTTSLIHINPGKLTNITKRLVKIDRENPTIYVSAYNTEFYGFRKDSIYGHLLLPADDQNTKDYTTTQDGIVLSYNASQSFDYVLSVSYTFSWIRSNGQLKKTTNLDKTVSYHVSDMVAPINVFIEGYDLEEKVWDIDSNSSVVNIKDNSMYGLETSILHSVKREYGYIRVVDLDGRGVIKILNKYEHPIIFINGEIIHPTMGQVEIAGDKIYVPGAKRNMTWCVMEILNQDLSYDMYYSAGITTKDYLEYNNTEILEEDNIIVFIDGLLIKKEDIIRDHMLGKIEINGLVSGQEYVMLKDKYHNLYDANRLTPAISTGKIDDTLVYLNNFLISNDTCVCTVESEDEVELYASNNEIKFFLESDIDRTKGIYKIYDKYNKKWHILDSKDVLGVEQFVHTYENMITAISLKNPLAKDDFLVVYGFHFCNTISNPLIIRSMLIDDLDDIPIYNTYVPEKGSINVWVNGIRQYCIKEYLSGDGLILPEKVTGKLTYVIETAEYGADIVCEREILTHDDMVVPNVYKTKKSLYPGRVVVYVSGIRQPNDSYSILDNNTIMFRDEDNMLIGNQYNYPEYQTLNGSFLVEKADEILVEVRQSYDWKEKTFQLKDDFNGEIVVDDYGIPREILETNDEILIFLNGMYTGLRNGIGYRKNRVRGCITILSSDFTNNIQNDPFYNHFMLDQDAYDFWKKQTGLTEYHFENKNINIITIEWR